MTNPKDSGVKAAKPIENPTKEDQNEAPTEEKTTEESLNVVVHPLVLLSVVDHFNRMGKIGNQKRVVGVLLGKFLRIYVKSFLAKFESPKTAFLHSERKFHDFCIAQILCT